MSFDILQHVFVPSHEILPKKEVKELLERLNTQKDKFPKVFVSDPVIKKISAKEGDVIKITRKSPTAGEAIYYRIVV